MERKRILLVVVLLALLALALQLSHRLGPDAAVAPLPKPAPKLEQPEPGEPVPPPAPRPPADLGAGDSFDVTAPDGAHLPVTVWRGRSSRAPVVLFVAATGEDADVWLPVLRSLRAARDSTLAVLWTQADKGRSAPSIPDPIARRSHEQARIALVFTQLRSRLRAEQAGLALVATSDAAGPALAAAAADGDVRATALLAPVLPEGDRELLEAIDQMAQRQVFLVFSEDDARAAPAVALLRQRLHTLRVKPVPGQAHGVELLRERPVQTDLTGWLFAVLGPRG